MPSPQVHIYAKPKSPIYTLEPERLWIRPCQLGIDLHLPSNQMVSFAVLVPVWSLELLAISAIDAQRPWTRPSHRALCSIYIWLRCRDCVGEVHHKDPKYDPASPGFEHRPIDLQLNISMRVPQTPQELFDLWALGTKLRQKDADADRISEGSTDPIEMQQLRK